MPPRSSTTTGVVRERSMTSTSKSPSVTSMIVIDTAYEIAHCARHQRVTRADHRLREALALEDQGGGPVVVGLHGLTATHRYVLMGRVPRAVRPAGRALRRARSRRLRAPRTDGDYSYAALGGDLEAVIEDARDRARAHRRRLDGGAHGDPLRARAPRWSRAGVVTPGLRPGAPRGDLARWDALARGLCEGGVDGFVGRLRALRVLPAWRGTVEPVLRQRLARTNTRRRSPTRSRRCLLAAL